MGRIDLTRAERFKDARVVHNQHGKETMNDVSRATGLSTSAISEIENEEKGRNIGADKIVALASHYGVSSDFLLGLSDDPKPTATAVADLNLSLKSVENIKMLKGCQESLCSVSLTDALDAILADTNLLCLLLQAVARLMDKWGHADPENLLQEQYMAKDIERLRKIYGNSIFAAYGAGADYLGKATVQLMFDAIIQTIQSTCYQRVINETEESAARWHAFEQAYPEKAEEAIATAQGRAKAINQMVKQLVDFEE